MEAMQVLGAAASRKRVRLQRYSSTIFCWSAKLPPVGRGPHLQII